MTASKRILIKNIVGHYVYLAHPNDYDAEKPVYSMRVIIKKEHPQYEEIKQTILSVAQDEWGSHKGVDLPVRLPEDTETIDVDGQPDYADAVFINTKNRRKPGILNPQKEQATESDFAEYCYSGGHFHVELSFYAYNFKGRKGIAAGLNHVMLLGGGTKIVSGVSTEAVFADVDAGSTNQQSPSQKVRVDFDEDDVPF